MVTYPQWTGDEPCRQVDPEIFYPTPTQSSTRSLVNLIKATCQSCPTFQARHALLCDAPCKQG